MADDLKDRRRPDKGKNRPLPDDFDATTESIKSSLDEARALLGKDFWKMTGPEIDKAMRARRDIEIAEGRLENRRKTSKRVRGR